MKILEQETDSYFSSHFFPHVQDKMLKSYVNQIVCKFEP